MADEYIKREDAIAKPFRFYWRNGVLSNPVVSVRTIKELPAADVVPVVRCKDCKHTKDDGCGAIYCKIWDRWEMPEDYFCANGKRKSDG